MRIDATSIASLLQSAHSLSNRQTAIAQQLSSGVRLSSLSDDASAAGRSAQLSSTLAQTDAFVQSATTTSSRLQAADTALSSVVSQLTSAVSIAVQGANDTQSTTDRNALAEQLTSIKESIRTLANSNYQGAYLFAGSKSTAEPFTAAADGTVTYSGDTSTSTLRLTNGDQIPDAVAGSTIFADVSNPVFSSLDSLITSLRGGIAPDTAQVATLRNALSTVITQRSVLGAQASRIDSEKTYVTSQQANLETDQSNLLASDPVSLATELSENKTQQSALLQSLAIVDKTSLFDYL